MVKLVNANAGTSVPGASVTVATAGAASGRYRYETLASPVILKANTAYYLLSQEAAEGDVWFDYRPVTMANVSTVNGPGYEEKTIRTRRCRFLEMLTVK